MANVTITELPTTITPLSTDILPIESGGVTSSVSIQNIVNTGLSTPGPIGITTPNAIQGTQIAATTVIGAPILKALTASGITIETSTGTTLAGFGTSGNNISLTPTALTINSTGNMDGIVLGATTPASGSFTSLYANNSLITQSAQVSLKGLTGGNTLQLSGAGATGNPELQLSVNDAGSTVICNITSVGGANTNAAIQFTGNNTTIWTLDVLGNFFPKQGTSGMSNGFMFIPGASGPPTSTPAVNNAGTVALYYDTASDEIFAYSNAISAWRSTAIGVQVGLFRANVASIPNITDTVVLFQNQDTLVGNNITYNGTTGAFTNVAADTVYLQVSYQIAWDNASAVGNRSQWISVNGDISTNRFAMQDITATGTDYDVYSGSATIQLTAGSYFQIYCWQDSGASLNMGGAFGGMATSYSTRVQFTVL